MQCEWGLHDFDMCEFAGNYTTYKNFKKKCEM
jgi:hypothetical protein